MTAWGGPGPKGACSSLAERSLVTPGEAGVGPTVAEVAPAAPMSGGEGVYDYRVPPALVGKVRPGVRVAVPLLGRVVEGYCLALKDRSAVPPEKLKDVARVLEPRASYPRPVLDLALWAARRYLCQPGEVLQAAAPAEGRYRAIQRARLLVTPTEALRRAEELSSRAPAQAAVLVELAARRGSADVATLRRRLGPGAARSLRVLAEKGLVALEEKAGEAGERTGLRREGAAPTDLAAALDSPPAGPVPGGAGDFRLTPAQEAAVEALTAALGGGGGEVFLLHGVTGSGKTEVFLRAAAEALARGRQVLILVPEVSLVPQTLERVRRHLGPVRVVVAHSYLAGRERLDYWEKVVTGQADVVVGARSAVFAPLDRLGLIVLDEEHEDAYKQEEGAPRYHAREVAAWRARHEKAVLVLSSATPSLESYHRALEGRYTLVSLPERAGGRAMPPVELVDMRAELASGNRSVFSRRLQAALAETLRGGGQAILFLNRRGHSTFVLCRDCGWVARCPHCAVSLTFHRPEADLACHYCGHRAPAPDRCPGCGGHRVRYFGAGTQRLEDEVRTLFPGARVARLDADAVRRRGEVDRILALFAAGRTDVLVGTQMVAKGLDLPGVGLVAAVSADSALHLPDFRSPERTFRLLVQAAGRAGRGSRPGRVIIQTYNPDHPAVAAASTHDYLSFARAEMEARRELGYPPFTHLVRVELSDRDEARAAAGAAALAGALERLGFRAAADLPRGAGEPRYAGPAPAPIRRLRGRHRWHVLVFSSDLESMLEAVKQAVKEATGRAARGGRRREAAGPVAAVDVDPVSVL